MVKRYLQDPYLEREQKKYGHPAPSREFLIEIIKKHGRPLKFEKLVELLELDDPELIDALSYRIKAMIRDGQLIQNRRNGLCLVNRKDLIHGRVVAHSDGFGFVKPDQGGEDLFLSPREMRSLWHDDRVVVQITDQDRRGRYTATVVEILAREHHQLVGRLYIEKGLGFVKPDHKRLLHRVIIPKDQLGRAKHGQIVVVQIIEHPTQWRQPIGKVVEILGHHFAPGMETDIAIHSHDIPVHWPEDVLKQIRSFSREVPKEAKKGRVDLRAYSFITIDGEDARDFDDAVYCQPTDKGWKLWVSIADVSAYVAVDSPLDKEAFKRGNSTYFPDRVVPMLPEILSNGLCSLNPRMDRLCLTAELFIDKTGRLYRSRFFESVIHSRARLTYEQVHQFYQKNNAPSDLKPHLDSLKQVYHALYQARLKRGAIDFSTVETRFKFNEQGKISAILPTERYISHRIIEECMLVANVAAARLLLRKKIPALYRVHEPPEKEKLKELKQFLAQLGLRMNLSDKNKPVPKDYAKLIESIQGREDAHMIQTVLLRSMMQAVYSPENIGHFGLAYPAYTHFTSPIRRYPDLIVHRAIKHLLRSQPIDSFYSLEQMRPIGEHCSMTERRSDEATRDAVDTLKCEFMRDKIGQTYEGLIVGVNSFGLFVELKNIYITGLVHITALNRDFFHFDPIAHQLTGTRSGQIYRLGDTIKVKVAAVNVEDRKIDLVLAKKKPKNNLLGD